MTTLFGSVVVCNQVLSYLKNIMYEVLFCPPHEFFLSASETAVFGSVLTEYVDHFLFSLVVGYLDLHNGGPYRTLVVNDEYALSESILVLYAWSWFYDLAFNWFHFPPSIRDSPKKLYIFSMTSPGGPFSLPK